MGGNERRVAVVCSLILENNKPMNLKLAAFILLTMGSNGDGCEPCINRKIPNGYLPDATQRGLNTIGCMIDTKTALPGPTENCGGRGRDGDFDRCVYARFSTRTRELSFGFGAEEDCERRFQRIDIYVKLPILTAGVYALAKNRGSGGYYGLPDAVVLSAQKGDDFDTGFGSGGAVEITRIDSVQQIVSGTFSFVAYGIPNNGVRDSVLVRGGRFDLKYEVVGY
jgi:hypothetical protein